MVKSKFKKRKQNYDFEKIRNTKKLVEMLSLFNAIFLISKTFTEILLEKKIQEMYDILNSSPPLDCTLHLLHSYRRRTFFIFSVMHLDWNILLVEMSSWTALTWYTVTKTALKTINMKSESLRIFIMKISNFKSD